MVHTLNSVEVFVMCVKALNRFASVPSLPREPQKSFSQQEIFVQDVTDEEYVEATLRRMQQSAQLCIIG